MADAVCSQLKQEDQQQRCPRQHSLFCRILIKRNAHEHSQDAYLLANHAGQQGARARDWVPDTTPKDEETKKREWFFFDHSYECLMRQGSDSVCSCDQYDAIQLHLQNMHADEFQHSLPGPAQTDRVESSSRLSAHAKFVLSHFTHKHHMERGTCGG